MIIGLGQNKTLVSLNLSWNTIVENTETVVKPEEEEKKFGMTGREFVSHREGEQIEWYEQEVVFSEFSTQAIENLCILLKRNKRLQHVNLT